MTFFSKKTLKFLIKLYLVVICRGICIFWCWFGWKPEYFNIITQHVYRSRQIGKVASNLKIGTRCLHESFKPLDLCEFSVNNNLNGKPTKQIFCWKKTFIVEKKFTLFLLFYISAVKARKKLTFLKQWVKMIIETFIYFLYLFSYYLIIERVKSFSFYERFLHATLRNLLDYIGL